MKSEQINELAAALSKAQGAMSAAALDAKNPHFNSRYATLASIVDAARKPLSDNGLAISQVMGNYNGDVVLLTVLMHSSGQWIQSEVAIKSQVNKGVNEVQALGSALTYYRRYALAAIIGISVADDDDDGETAQVAKPKPATQQKPAQPKPSDKGPAPTTADELLALVDRKVEATYNNVPHLFNAIRNELGAGWTWPEPGDAEGWRSAYAAAKRHADAKVKQPEPQAEAEPDEDDGLVF